MSFIIDINVDSHRIFTNKLDQLGIKTKTIWTKGTETCLDTVTHDDYSKAKDLQIQLDKQYDNIPCV